MPLYRYIPYWADGLAAPPVLTNHPGDVDALRFVSQVFDAHPQAARITVLDDARLVAQVRAPAAAHPDWSVRHALDTSRERIAQSLALLHTSSVHGRR